jgi:hypothetical protein
MAQWFGVLKIACYRLSEYRQLRHESAWVPGLILGGQSSRDRQRADIISKPFGSVSISRTHNALFAATARASRSEHSENCCEPKD